MSPTPIVLIHGFATTAARTWGETGWLDLLADTGRPVVPITLMGHGEGVHSHDPADYDELEAHAAAQLPDEPFDAIGFSMGARVLLTLASRQPERFGRLIVAGVGANLFRDDDVAAVAAAISADEDTSNPVAHHFRQLARADGSDVEALSAFLRRPNPPALTDAVLAAVSCPVLVVLGDEDFAGPAEPLVDRLPDARLTTLPGVDHFATPRSFAFIDAALSFIDAVPA